MGYNTVPISNLGRSYQGMTTIETMEDPSKAMKKSMETKRQVIMHEILFQRFSSLVLFHCRKCIPSFTQISAVCGGRNFLLWPVPCLTMSDTTPRRTHIV